VPDISVTGAHDGQHGHDPHDGVDFIRVAEQLALEQGGVLHWGQSNGLMLSTTVWNTYGEGTIMSSRALQQKLGGSTVRNYFLGRRVILLFPVNACLSRSWDGYSAK